MWYSTVFCFLLIHCADEVLHAVSVSDDKGKSKSASVQEHSNIVIQYKELIREQVSYIN